MTTTDPETLRARAAEIARGLTEAQRWALVAVRPLVDGRILVPATIQRKKWPPAMIDIYSIAFRRLTPLGLAVRAHLQGNPHDD